MTEERKLPLGFSFAGVPAGIKQSGARDLCLVAADSPGRNFTAAGVYTSNLVRAASIDWNRSLTPADDIAALLINSGNANACTGDGGRADNHLMAAATAAKLDCQPEQVLVLSTGIIGQRMPMDKVIGGIDAAFQSLESRFDSFSAAAEAILTTDKSTKTAYREVEIEGTPVHLAGFCKGAGMIGPRMATMLCVLMTDASLTQALAQQAVETAVNQSFNRISVEGHMSTNDAVILLSSGVQNVEFKHSEDYYHFVAKLTEMCVDLAKMIPADGEGASHLVTIDVDGAHDDDAADRIARVVANSNLVKTAVAGNDPNWGRIVSAAGYAGIEFQVDEVKLEINEHLVFDDGQPVEFDEHQVSQSMADSFETLIKLRIGHGPGQSKHWTSDLTEQYVRFNSDYST